MGTAYPGIAVAEGSRMWMSYCSSHEECPTAAVPHPANIHLAQFAVTDLRTALQETKVVD
jgi:hypothetical protein